MADITRQLSTFMHVVITCFLFFNYCAGSSNIFTHNVNSFSKDVLGNLDTNNLDAASQILKEELQQLQKDMTTALVEELSRNKRDTTGYDYEVVLGPLEEIYDTELNSTLLIPTDRTEDQPVIFQGQFLLLEKDGIYKIMFVEPSNETLYNSSAKIVDKVLLGRWNLSTPGDEYRVSAAIEKNNVLFVLVTAKKSGFSYLFTYAPLGSGVALRQRIRNHGTVTAAKFFIFYNVLYLVITHDNEVHSITLCPIFKWLGTHLDEIHVVHTRGASSVDVIEISGYLYLAFAQAEDAAGNREIGTQILRMDRKSEVEKVQLLYSDHPTTLHFTKFLHEYILIVVQKKMPAIVYFFGGYDFIYLQHLNTLKGAKVKVISVLAPDGETFILASNGTEISTFSRSSATSRLTALMFVPYPNSTYNVDLNYLITGMTAKPPQFYDGNQDDRLILAIQIRSSVYQDDYRVELHTLRFEKVSTGLSSYKQPDDSVSNCLLKLQTSLADSEPYVEQLKKSNAVILRKSANMVYHGSLNSQKLISFDSETTKADHVIIKPNVNIDDESKLTPTQLKQRIQDDISKLQSTLKNKLSGVFLRNVTNNVSGSINFVNGFHVDKLTANMILADELNNIPWNQLKSNVLRTDKGKRQIVTGSWNISEIHTQSVDTVDSISNISISDILLTHTNPEEVQIVESKMEFRGPVQFHDLIIPLQKSMNHIKIGDIANKTSGTPVVLTGAKTAGIVHVGEGTTVDRINGINLTEWYESVLKTTGPPQYANGTYIFEGEFDAENVNVEQINGKNWEEFLESVLLDGSNQTLYNYPRFDKLDVQCLDAVTINGIEIDGLLNKYSHQNVSAPVKLKSLHVIGNVTSKYTNGLDLNNDVVVYNKDAEIYGPLEFHNLTVDHFKIDDGVLISGVDIVLAEKARKSIVYKVKEDNPIFLKSIKAKEVDINTVNNFPVSNFDTRYWTKSGNNIVPVRFDFSNTVVNILGNFTAEKINNVPVEDYVSINEDSSPPSEEFVDTEINFTKPVMIHGSITLGPGVTLNNINISSWIGQLVHTYDSGVIYGTKSFSQPIVARHGLWVDYINNHSVEDDFVMLRNGRSQYVLHDLGFDKLHVENLYVNDNATIEGRLNRLNVSDIRDKTVYNDKPAVIVGDVKFLQDVQAENIFISGKLNNYSVVDILENYIVLDKGETPQYIYLSFDILGDLEFYGPVDIEAINGINPTEYFSSLVNRSRDVFIRGEKIFKRPVVVDGNLLCTHDKVNNVVLPELEDMAVSGTKNQIITGKVTIGEVNAHNLHTFEICGIPVSEFVLLGSRGIQEINSPVIFTNPTSVRGNITLNGTFNGYDIHEIYKNLTHISGNRSFNTLTCNGDLNWVQARRDIKGFSFVFNNAVRNGTTEAITGKLKFLSGFTAEAIETKTWFNGVDLQRIKDDGVYRNEDVNFTGYNYIPLMHIGIHGSLHDLKSIKTESINGVNLTELYKQAVRHNDTRVIRGKKTLQGGATAESIFVDDINGCPFSNVALVNDNRTIDNVTLVSVEGTEDVNFKWLNLFPWKEFLENRVTLSTNQTIRGNWVFEENLNVKDFSAKSINGLRLADAVRTNAEQIQNVHGRKTFYNLNVNGDIEAHSINGNNIDYFCDVMVHKDRPEYFNQTVYLHGPVTFYKNMDVEQQVNEHDLKTIKNEFQEKLDYIRTQVSDSNYTKQETEQLLQVLKEELQEAAVWLDYLSLVDYLDLVFDQPERVEVAMVGDIARISFSKFEVVTNGACGLPNGCVQNSIDIVEFGNNHYEKFQEIKCMNVFEVSSSQSDRAYSIVSSVVSYNETCTTISPEKTEIYTATPSISNSNDNDTLIGTVITGYVSDVKTFTDQGVDYIVIAQFFDKAKGSQGAEVGIFAISNGIINKIQSIPSKTIKIALDQHNGHWFLGVANSLSNSPSTIYQDEYDEEEEAPFTVSEVFKWSSSNSHGEKGQFILLRQVATVSVVDVEFLQVYPHEHGFEQEFFVAFVHSGNVLDILKYRSDVNNFFISQTLAFDNDHRVTSLSSFSIKTSTYLIVSSVPQGLLIYQYKCIEGFKPYFEVPLAEVQDVQEFILEREIFFAVASSTSLIANGKIQGPAFE